MHVAAMESAPVRYLPLSVLGQLLRISVMPGVRDLSLSSALALSSKNQAWDFINFKLAAAILPRIPCASIDSSVYMHAIYTQTCKTTHCYPFQSGNALVKAAFKLRAFACLVWLHQAIQ